MGAHWIVRCRVSHIFYTIGSQMTVRFSALSAGRLLTPSKIPGTHFCWRLSRPQGHSAAVKIRSTEKIHLIGTRMKDYLTENIIYYTDTVIPAQMLALVHNLVSCS
jgi:hypothetical protein